MFIFWLCYECQVRAKSASIVQRPDHFQYLLFIKLQIFTYIDQFILGHDAIICRLCLHKYLVIHLYFSKINSLEKLGIGHGSTQPHRRQVKYLLVVMCYVTKAFHYQCLNELS